MLDYISLSIIINTMRLEYRRCESNMNHLFREMREQPVIEATGWDGRNKAERSYNSVFYACTLCGLKTNYPPIWE